MRRDYYNNSKDYINRWVISYADLVTLLLALFLAMFAINNTNQMNRANTSGITTEEMRKNTVKMPEIQKELLKEFKNDENIILLKDTRGLIIRMNNSILFSNAESKLQETSYSTLNKIVDFLSKIDNPVIIEGHTDSFPINTEKYSSNWELSSARASSVVNYLVKTKRINPRRLSAVGYGEFVPVAENTSNSGRTKNRRVDIIILNNNIGD